MSSAEGHVIACSRDNLPEPILDYILDLAGTSIADARAFSLVCRAWLIPARAVLFREVTVLVGSGYRITASVGKTHPDGREITLYPRCMAARGFTQLASCTSYLLSFVQVLKTSNDDLVQFLSSNMPNGSLQRIRELWLSDMSVSTDVDFHRLFEHFPVLRALRIQKLRGARPSRDADILGVERAGPVFVRLVGCVSLALRDSLAGSNHSQIVEFSTFHVDPVETYADGVAGVFRKHADTLSVVNFYMPYFAMGNAHIFTSIVPILDERCVLHTLHLEFVQSSEAALIIELLTVPRLASLRYLRITFNGCLSQDAGLEHLCAGVNELLAQRVPPLERISLIIPCSHWACPIQLKKRFPLLSAREVLRVCVIPASEISVYSYSI
ncbi:hypothetical protein EXIGLDRAFT_733288 [Exidia glandulosa HHB12029]|uniref:F-box domain-containing protein n=1 Tax=Exidia glandulosa HHB12029 TaxID=1314781 RepID=A0A165BBT8_EXIGL|nr:hypothetical protein EXIGLDRAFT_733288 [Exidia glandulosa HHB12029]